MGSSSAAGVSRSSRWALEDRSLVAAVDVNIGAADESGALRRQERDRMGDILERAPAPERDLGAPARFLLLQAAAEMDLVMQRKRVGQRAPDTARADRVDQDLAGRELVGQRLDEGMLRRIGDRRRDRVGLWHLAGL